MQLYCIDFFVFAHLKCQCSLHALRIVCNLLTHVSLNCLHNTLNHKILANALESPCYTCESIAPLYQDHMNVTI